MSEQRMIERVTDAVREVAKNGGPRLMERCARAAITAMREPTEAMKRAAKEAIHADGFNQTKARLRNSSSLAVYNCGAP